jgi:hypothetical protein
MPLSAVELPTPRRVPAAVRKFVAEADLRIERFQMKSRCPAFVPSDYPGAYSVLRELADRSLIRGNRFCEWGSGFGVVTCLAAMLDYEAYGVEVEPELVTQAQLLAEDFGLSAEFARGSFVPRSAESRVCAAGEYAWLTTDGDDSYEELGLEIDDMDVVYAYPWPDEEDVTAKLFERYAGAGAVLVTYHSAGEGFRVRRKVERKKKR